MTMPMNSNKQSVLGYLALVSLFGVTGLAAGALYTPTTQAQKQQASATAALSQETVVEQTNVDITVIARAAYLFDSTNNSVVFAKNETTQLPLASLTKLFVALLVHEHLDPDAMVSISATALAVEGESGFEQGELWRVQDLLDYTLITSSNDGAAALAEAIERTTGTDIVTLLNALTGELGLSQTFFLNETGLDSNTALAGAYGSARDVALFLQHVYITDPALLEATVHAQDVFTNVHGKVYEATSTNRAITKLPGLVLGKTGFTDLAGGNLAVITESEPGHPFISVVLGSTIDARFDDVVRLTHATLREPEQ